MSDIDEARYDDIQPRINSILEHYHVYRLKVVDHAVDVLSTEKADNINTRTNLRAQEVLLDTLLNDFNPQRQKKAADSLANLCKLNVGLAGSIIVALQDLERNKNKGILVATLSKDISSIFDYVLSHLKAYQDRIEGPDRKTLVAKPAGADGRTSLRVVKTG